MDITEKVPKQYKLCRLTEHNKKYCLNVTDNSN